MNNQIRKLNYICNLFFRITSFCTVVSCTNLVSAQIIPDNSLPNNSEVGIEGNITKIEGGTQSGSNLFHSFEKFGVSTGGEAHFNNGVDISNIITRVTGKSISDIDGLIKANGTANLFLINPNGIVFGENAKLDIGGSFVGSTADSIKFLDDVEFSAVNPQSKPLLSINVPLGLQYGRSSGDILVKGDRQGIRASSEIPDTQNGLRVKPNQTLALVGGDINLEGASLKSGEGRIELGSVVALGLVNIAPVEKGFSFNYDDVDGGNIKLSQQTTVDASGEGAGDIRVWGRNIKISDGSLIETSTLGSKDGGSLVVNAQESVEVIGSSNIQLFTGLSTDVYSQAIGKGADLNINTHKLVLQDWAVVGTSTLGKGDSGNLTVDAKDVQVIGAIQDDQSPNLWFPSFLGTSASSNSTGDAGDLKIKTNNLLVKDGATVSSDAFSNGNGGNSAIETNNLLITDGGIVGSSTLGQGKGGNVTVDAKDVQVIGGNRDDLFLSSLTTSASSNSTGDAGDLMIKTNNLLIKDGATVSSSTLGQGKGGNVTIDAKDVQAIGISNDGHFIRLDTSAQPNSTGDAGDLMIKTNNLLIKDGAIVQSSTFSEGEGGNLTIEAQDVQLIGRSSDGRIPSGLDITSTTEATGDAGDLTIKANSLLIKDGANVSSSISGKSKGGNLTIEAQDIQLIGSGGLFPSGLNAFSEATEDAGDLTIKTYSLLLKDGAQVSTGTNGEGEGGNLTIEAQDAQLIGTSSDGQIPSGFFTRTQDKGNTGELKFNVGKLLVQDGAQVSVSTVGAGTASTATINASESIQVSGDGSGLFNRTGGTGDAGTLKITTQDMTIKSGAQLSVDNFTELEYEQVIIKDGFGERVILVPKINPKFGLGNTGNLVITANSIELSEQGEIVARSAEGQGGNIILNIADLLLMRGNSQISTSAGIANTGGDGGNITINTPNGFIVTTPNENSDITANAFEGKGGQVKINATGIFGMVPRSRKDLVNLSKTNDSRALLNANELPTNDITAISQQNPDLSGTVEIITPQTDPTSGSIQFPTIPVETEVANACSTPGYAQSSFTITGKGSLPPSPLKPLVGRANQTKLATLEEHGEIKTQGRIRRRTSKKAPDEIKPIVEARGWVRTKDGRIILVANAPEAISSSGSIVSKSCSVKQ